MKTLFLFLILFILLSLSANATSDIYSWKDANGVTNYSDNPASAPVGAKVTVFEKRSETEEPQPPTVIQGQFARELVKELGLKRNPTPREAVDLLDEVRIAPPLGRWHLNQPMTPELTVRLRRLTSASVREGRLDLPEEDALLAFDTSAAELGLAIPGIRPTTNESSDDEIPPPTPNYEPSDADYPPNPNPPPPLVTYMVPGPEFYPYYYWYPVVGGFWVGSIYYSGYFVLNTNRFYHDHGGYRHDDRMIRSGTRTVGGQVPGRMINSQVRSAPALIPANSGGSRSIRTTSRISTPAFAPRQLIPTPPWHGPSVRAQSSHMTNHLFRRPSGQIQAAFHGRSVR